MKVIAIKGKGHRPNYVCEISHTEIEKILNLYYGKKDELEIEEEINLSAGYEFHEDILEAIKKMEDLIEHSENVTRALKQAKVLKSRIKKEL